MLNLDDLNLRRKHMNFDVIVIGGGTSGLMAAISAAEHGAKVAIIEKNRQLGKKLRLTGGGRCNVTNNRPPEEIIEFIPGNGKFLYSAFSQFNNYDIMSFFESHQIPLKEEDHGRMFPVANTSKAIVAGLTEQLEKNKVTVFLKTEAEEIICDHESITGVKTNEGVLTAPCVILSTGGKTYQYTGSTGDGYHLAKSLGHHVTRLFPTESPIKSDDPVISSKKLQGLALRDVSLSVINQKGKTIVSHQMDLLFTHFGISGPAALRCSMFVNQELAKGIKKVPLQLDSLPKLTAQEVKQQLLIKIAEEPKKAIKNGFKGILPDRYLEFLIELATIDGTLPLKQLTDEQLDGLVNQIKKFNLTAYATYPLDKSFVTGGGIELREVQPKSMESKLINGLFFTGELLDINGYTGGYNITAAFITGYVAGKHAAEISSYHHY